jgi:hypothetical protein
MCDNGEAGVAVSSVAGVTLDSNTITGNRSAQIWIPWLADEHEQIAVTDFETGRQLNVQTTRWSLTGNTVRGGLNALLIAPGRWSWFFTTIFSDNNRWQHSERQDSFAFYPRNGDSPTRLNFRQWQMLSNSDAHSSFELGSSSPQR